MAAIAAANALATVCRFLVLRRLIAGSRRQAAGPRPTAARGQGRIAAADHQGVDA